MGVMVVSVELGFHLVDKQSPFVRGLQHTTFSFLTLQQGLQLGGSASLCWGLIELLSGTSCSQDGGRNKKTRQIPQVYSKKKKQTSAQM